MNSEVVKKAFIRTIPVMAGYLVLGTGFGILLRNSGEVIAFTDDAFGVMKGEHSE